jgi:hypothetical protein
MYPIIYELKPDAETVEWPKDEIYEIDKHNVPRALIKYGYIDNLNEIVTDDNNGQIEKYEIGAEINPSDIMPEFTSKFKLKSKTELKRVFFEYWELFKFLAVSREIQFNTKSVKSIGGHNDVIESVIDIMGLDDKKANHTFIIDSAHSLGETNNLTFILKHFKAIHDLKKESNLIIKLENIFTLPMIKLIYFLMQFFTIGYIFKPLVSMDLLPTKYIVLINLNTSITHNLTNPSSGYLLDIFPTMPISNYFTSSIQNINSIINGQQLVAYHEIKTYLQSNNAYGSMYEKFKARQRESVVVWVKYFITDKKDEKLFDKLIMS